jgi:putative membrane protein
VTSLPPEGCRQLAGRRRTDFASWHRLHPLSPLVRAGRQLLTIVVLVLVLFFANHHGAGSDLVVNLLLVAVLLAGGVVSWLVTRWQVADGVLRIETGLVRRQSLRFPLSQVQAIDVVQTGLARVLGLAELRLRMAGADSSGGRLASLPLADAERLRRRLLSMARAPGAAATGRPAVTAGGPAVTAGGPVAPPGTEGASGQADDDGDRWRRGSRRRAGTAAVPGTAGAPRRGHRHEQDGRDRCRRDRRDGHRRRADRPARRRGVVLPFGLGIVLAVWRQFNGEYGTVVAAAADGLRLRSGLVQTTAETIRPGRVQAVRLVEPLVWRAFGWCRLEVDVAGPRQRRENRSESRRLRALIPVGSRADAEQMISELLTTRPAPSQRAPRSARWKAPLTYHFLAWGSDDRYVVAVARPGLPEDDLGPAGEGAERPLGAGPGPAPARAGVGAAGRRGQAGDREHPGPRRRRGARNPPPAARPGQQCAETSPAGLAS